MKLKVVPFIVIAMLISLFPHGTAKATSIYDDVVNAPSSWKVIDSNGLQHDVNIHEVISNITDGQQKTICESVYTKLQQMDYRYFEQYQPDDSSMSEIARAWATNEQPGVTEWSDYGSARQVHSIWHNTVGISVEWKNNALTIRECSDGTNNTYTNITYAMKFNSGWYIIKPHHTEGFQIDYPNNYAGQIVPSTNRTGLITGNVQCANTNNVISAVLINTNSGIDGSARLSDDSIGGKDYKYYLSETSPYHLTVICDDDIFYSPTVDVALYNPYNWYCAPSEYNENYCYAG